MLSLARVGGALPADADGIKNIYAFNAMSSIDRRKEMAGVFADLTLKDFMLGLHTTDGIAYTYDAEVRAAALAERERTRQNAEPAPRAKHSHRMC